MNVVLGGMKSIWILLYISIRVLGWPDGWFDLLSKPDVSLLSRPKCFPFLETFWGHYRIINWPNFNTVESQGTERLRREGEGNGSEWGAVRTHTTFSIKFAFLYGCSPGCPAKNYNNNIKNHGSQFPVTNRVKNLRYGENCQNVTETHGGQMLLGKWHWKTWLM